MGSEPLAVALLTHSQPADTGDAIERAAAAAATAGHRLVVSATEAAKHGNPDCVEVVDDVVATAKLCLVLGGDGSILRAMEMFAHTDVPVFGINYGTVGFLAAAERDDLDAAFACAFTGRYDVMEMPGLEIVIDGVRHTALNDVSFTRRPHGRVAELSYNLGGKEVGHVRCDGLVAATPAGSTGYNLANHGPILAWGVEGYVVSFIAPHTLTARALVVAPDDQLLVHNAGGRDPVEIAVDGVPSGELPSGADIEVGFRNGVARLAQLPGSNFYRRIREKFGLLAR